MDTLQSFQMVSVDRIHEHPRNPRQGDTDMISESMEEVGFYGAITVHRSSGDIIAGNHRYRTAVARGASEVPVVWYDGTEEQALKILLGDNRIADSGDYDREQLDDILASLPTLKGTGYDLSAIESDLDPDAEPAPVGIPDDIYTPLWAIQIPCESEEDQQELYELLTRSFEKRGEEREIRVLAL